MRNKFKNFAIFTAVGFLLVLAQLSPSQAQPQSAAPKLPPLKRLTPPFTADKLVIREEVRQKNFAQLDSGFERYQQAFEANPAAELNEKLAFDSFAADDPLVGDQIEEWIIARPNSFAAHMAMASYFSWRGWHTRGPAPADQTSSTQFEKMQQYFAQSANEAKAALKLKPKLSLVYAALLAEARGVHDETLHRQLQDDALSKMPTSFVIREEVMESLFPRWGGSHEAMAEFAKQSQAVAKENPCMHWLLGFVDSDEGETLGLHGEYEQSIAALTSAIQKGGDYSGFYFDRGIGYAKKGSYPQALEDFDRANELWPQDPELLIRRAVALAELKQPQMVLADLKLVSMFEAPDALSTQLHDWAAKASKEPQH